MRRFLTALALALLPALGLAQVTTNPLITGIPNSGNSTSITAGPNGTAAAPAFSFTGDPDTGLYDDSANVLCTTTAGTARWCVNGSGTLVPYVDNTYDIGNGTANPRDINASRALIAPQLTLAGTAITAKTGTGSMVLSTSPALVTPTLGVASATSVRLGSGTTLATFVEGTFTPTFNAASGSGATVTIAAGFYTQIGNRVFFNLQLATNGLGTTSGNLTVGLGTAPSPTGVASSQGSAICSQASNMAITAGQNVTGLVNINAATMGLYIWSATTGTAPLQVSQWNTSGSLFCAGSYPL